MVSIMVSRALENLPHFRAEHCLHSIRLTLPARHSAYVGGVHSQFLCHTSVKSAEKRNKRRWPVRGFVTIHGILSGVMTRFQRSRQPNTDVIPPDVLFCLVRHTFSGAGRNAQAIEKGRPVGGLPFTPQRDGVFYQLSPKGDFAALPFRNTIQP